MRTIVTVEGETRCRRCRRTLRSQATRTAGIGTTCARKERAEQAYSADQRAKALQVLEDGAIARTPLRTPLGRPVFAVVASSGEQLYFATKTGCTCPAGVHGRRCYHQLAVVYSAA